MIIAAVAALIAATAIQAVRLFRAERKGGAGRPALDPSALLYLAAGALLIARTIVRSFEIGFVALTGTHEILVFFAAATALLLFAYLRQRRIPREAFPAFFAGVFAVALLALASSPLVPQEAQAPLPILRSHWLVLHVGLAVVGEAFFLVSFAASLLFLASKNAEKRKRLDRVAYAAIAAGYPVFTVGALAFGAVWAEEAWGSWWSWDPKETWALATWLAYTFYLHLRLVVGKKGAACAVVSVVGFLCALFTFFGVNYLLPGLHSYR